MDRLYIITRSDIPHGLQLAQSCHAVSVFADAHPLIHRSWVRGANNIVCLSVGNEVELECIAQATRQKVRRFFEPDLEGQLTAIAIEDAEPGLVGSLPLALKKAA